jgi:hypothetical protein
MMHGDRDNSKPGMRSVMSTITMDTNMQRNREMIYADMAGDTVMFSIEQGEYYGLDAIGTRIWHLLEKEMSVQEICTILRSEYDVSGTQCGDDVRRFLQELLDQHIIEVR